MLSLTDYRFLKNLVANIQENRDFSYVFNQCLGFSKTEIDFDESFIGEINEAAEIPPWRSAQKAYIAIPNPESVSKWKAEPYKTIKNGKKVAKNPPRKGFQGTLLHGITNAKIAKSWKKGYDSYILNLSPAEESGFNLCSCSTAGCALQCLHLSGSLVYQKAKMKSRLGNTFYLVKERQKFIEQLVSELDMAHKYAHKRGRKMAVRLNGTSDLPWEEPEFGLDGKNIFQMFPDVQFYDYSKIIGRVNKFVNNDYPKNYHLTFSYSERPSSPANSKATLEKGGNVAIVFGPGKASGQERLIMPKKWNGFDVVDGDKSDLRFEDPKGTVVALSAKADAAWDFHKIGPQQLQQIIQIFQSAGIKDVITKSGLSKQSLQALHNTELLGGVIDVLRQVKPTKKEDQGSGFVVPPEDPSVDPRRYPENLSYAIQGIQKKLSRAFAGQDKREVYRQIRKDFYSKHGDLYKDYLARIEDYCKRHPEECKDTDKKFMPIAKAGNPLAQAGIGIPPENLVQIGVLNKKDK